MSKTSRELLVVDGYNVIYGTPRYAELLDEPSPGSLDHDVAVRAREALVADVAAFAQGSYEARIVFDGAGNVSPTRDDYRVAGVTLVFSPAGTQADPVIERMVTDARDAGRRVTVVTSDATIQATVFGDGVTRISSRMLAGEVAAMTSERDRDVAAMPAQHLTVGDRLSPEVREKLFRMARNG